MPPPADSTSSDGAKDERLLGALIYGGPLLVAGIFLVSSGLQSPVDGLLTYVLQGVGLCYALSALSLFSSWKGAPATAIVAWATLVILLPMAIMTNPVSATRSGPTPFGAAVFFAFFAIRGLMRWNFHEPPQPALGGKYAHINFLATLFVDEFGGHSKRDGSPLSLREDLLVPPIQICQFLQNLKLDHRLPVSADDAPCVDSLEDLLKLIDERAAART